MFLKIGGLFFGSPCHKDHGILGTTNWFVRLFGNSHAVLAMRTDGFGSNPENPELRNGNSGSHNLNA